MALTQNYTSFVITAAFSFVWSREAAKIGKILMKLNSEHNFHRKILQSSYFFAFFAIHPVHNDVSSFEIPHSARDGVELIMKPFIAISSARNSFARVSA